MPLTRGGSSVEDDERGFEISQVGRDDDVLCVIDSITARCQISQSVDDLVNIWKCIQGEHKRMLILKVLAERPDIKPGMLEMLFSESTYREKELILTSLSRRFPHDNKAAEFVRRHQRKSQ